MKRGTFVLALVLAACASDAWSMDHSGSLSGDETWGPLDNPHRIVDSVIVPISATLRLLPGTLVQIHDDDSLRVNGALRAIGTEEQRITITSYTGAPATTDWRRIVLAGSGGVDSLVYCDISCGGRYSVYSEPAIRVSGRNSLFDHCRVFSNYGAAFVLTSGSRATVRDCEIFSNGGAAIAIDISSQPRFEGPTAILYDNSFNGVQLSGNNTINVDTRWYRMGYGGSPADTSAGLPFYVNGNLTVASGRIFRVDPGVVFRLSDDDTLRVNGSLRAMGTEQQRITFTSLTGAPASSDWRRIVLAGSGGVDSLVYCDVSCGGRYSVYSEPAIRVSGRNSFFDHCRVFSNYGAAFVLTSGSRATVRDCEIFSNGGAAIAIDINSQPHFEGAIALVYGNGFNGVQLSGNNTISVDTRWHRMGYGSAPADTSVGLPFYINGHLTVDGGRLLRLDPGFVFRFGDDDTLRVNGSLRAVGADAQRITITSLTGAPASTDWRRIVLAGSGGVDSLVYCDVSCGGRYSVYSEPAIRVSGRNSFFDHCRVFSNYGAAFVLTSGSRATVRDCEILSNGGAAIAIDIGSQPRFEGATALLYGNSFNGIFIGGNNTINADTRWHRMGYGDSLADTATGLPFYVTGHLTVASDRILRLDPGFVFRFGNDDTLRVNGSLRAVGTGAQRITITSLTGAPASTDWRRIVLAGSGGVDSLAYCDISCGGRYSIYSEPAIRISGRNSLLDHCRVFSNYGDGLFIGGGSDAKLRHCEFFNNGGDAVEVATSSAPEVWYCCLNVPGTTNAGVRADATSHVDARWTYWNSSDGPAPTGHGSLIIGNVDYLPYHVTCLEPTDVPETVPEAPALVTALAGAYPNPFNPSTTIAFSLASSQFVTLDIYDVRGRHVRSLLRQTVERGSRTVLWDGRDDAGQSVASGVYVLRLRAEDITAIKKLMMIE